MGQDLAQVVTTQQPYDPGPRPNGSSRARTARRLRRADRPKFHVVAYDFGVKKNILRMLASRGVKVTVVPARTRRPRCWHNPDGIFLSNGLATRSPVTTRLPPPRN